MDTKLPALARRLEHTLGLAFCLAAAGTAWAAGGHHSLDDATILAPGTCEAEGWYTGYRHGPRLAHLGGACGAGPVELGIAAEHAREDGSGASAYAVQVKWAREWAPGFSAGASVTASWQAHVRPRYQATTAMALATWTPREDVALHFNFGRDIVHGGPGENRGGLSAEWMPREDWSLTAERYREQGTHFVRAGARWSASEDWTLDFSRAQRLRGPVPSSWTVGVTRRFRT